MRRTVAAAAALAVVLSGCQSSPPKTDGGELVVYVSAPVRSAPWNAQALERGARLAVEEVNANGGVGPDHAQVRLVVGDHGGTVSGAVARARDALDQQAVLLLTDGVGAVATAEATQSAKLPVVITFDGSSGLVDEKVRPTVFRLAPANTAMCRRLADYIAETRHRVAVIHDDSAYGADGATDLAPALRNNAIDVRATVPISAGAVDVSPAVTRARQSGATAVIVWARAPALAAMLRAIRASGWTAPVYAGPTGEDPLVRQQLADHKEWVDGLTFVSFRITAEVGPEPFQNFRAAYEKRWGPELVGVGGVVQPPDFAMYPYDAIKLLQVAYGRAGAHGQPLIDALNAVSITGANGDERSFSPANHEGVVPDDMYFGVFKDWKFTPVKDDPLSAHLPAVPQ